MREPTPLADNPEPMQIGASQISPEEQRRRVTQRLCMYCGGSGHFLAACPARGNKVEVMPAPSLVHNQL